MKKKFLTYSAGAIILRLIMALSVLLTIKFITPDQFGILALLNNLTIFIPIILGLGLRQVLAIEFFKRQDTWGLVWDLNLIYLVFAIPTGIVLLLNLTALNLYLFNYQINNCLILLVIITSMLNFWPELLFQLLRFQQKAVLLITIQTMMGILLAGTTSYLLFFGKLGLISVLLAQLITQLLATLYFAYLLFKNKNNFNLPSLELIISYLKTGLPFVPNIILAWLILAANRWLLNWQLNDMTQVGIYSLGENLSLMFQTIITQPLMHSFLPHAFSQLAQNSDQIKQLDRQYQSVANWFILGFTILIPAGFLIAKPILCLILPSKYLTTLPLLVPLLIAQAIFAASYLSNASLQYNKKTHLLVVLMAISAILAILINLWLIPIYQIYSCPIALNCAYLFYFIATWLLKIKIKSI